MKRTYALVRYGIAATAVAAFVGLLLDTGSPAETAKPMHLRLAYSAITVNQAIPWISYEAGHFKKYGLNMSRFMPAAFWPCRRYSPGRL